MTTSIVLDIETLDTTPQAVITEIGLVAFNRDDFTPFDELRLVPDLFYQLLRGRSIGEDTIEFHRKNGTLPETTRGITPIAAIVAIQDFITRHRPHRVWIQGTDFDRPIIEDFCRSELQPLPWKYSISRDARTLWDTTFPGVKHVPRPHRAIQDCRATLCDIYTALKALDRLQAC